MSDYIWKLYDRKETDLISHLCRIRAIDPKALEPDFTEHLHNPNLLPDMAIARALLREAVEKKWSVTIFGDYDADGTPAAAVLAMTCERLGLTHQVILPTRKTGYGINMETIEGIKDSCQLLITVDTGITAIEEVALAKKYAIKVIIIDHHLPKSIIPNADAVIDPFVPSSKYPFKYLCGCALAYKLVVALQEDFPQQITVGFSKWLLDLVAISTVADMMPIVGENRVLVHYGLKVLAKTRWPGLTELMRQADIRPDQLSSQTLGYVIGPRLNASGRLLDNRPAYQLLVSKSINEASAFAREIETANYERRELVKNVLANVEKQLWKQNKSSDHLIVIAGNNWPSGVLGLVAGKIVGLTNRPAIVLSITDQGVAGSARSIDSYSLIDALERSSNHLKRFGGHTLAAGIALDKKNLSKFVDSIKKDAQEKISADQLRPTITIDAEIGDHELNYKTTSVFDLLAPFGQGNPLPIVLKSSMSVSSPRKIGSAGNHLKAFVKSGDSQIDMIGFGLAEKYFNNPLSTIDIVGHLEENIWNGRKSLQIKLKDFRPAGSGVDEVLSLPL